jgi:hypothetical protein
VAAAQSVHDAQAIWVPFANTTAAEQLPPDAVVTQVP